MATPGKLESHQYVGKDWLINGTEKSDGCLAVGSTQDITNALLVDIRAELRKLNAVFACPNFQQIPKVLRTIRGNTSRIPPRAK